MTYVIVWRGEPWKGPQSRIDAKVGAYSTISSMAKGFTRNGCSYLYFGTVEEFKNRCSVDLSERG